MGTYAPPPFPRRPKHASPASQLAYQMRLAYYRYQLDFGLYVMSPMEKIILNTVVLCFLSLLLYCGVPLLFNTLPRSIIRQFALPQAARTIPQVLPPAPDSSLLVAQTTNEGIIL